MVLARTPKVSWKTKQYKSDVVNISPSSAGNLLSCHEIFLVQCTVNVRRRLSLPHCRFSGLVCGVEMKYESSNSYCVRG